MLPDAGGGVPLTYVWWLAVIILATCMLIVGAAVSVFTVWLQRRDKAWEAQSKAIIDLQNKLHDCQMSCATDRGKYVRREDFEGRWLRVEEMVVRIHERVDQMALKLGLPNETRKSA